MACGTAPPERPSGSDHASPSCTARRERPPSHPWDRGAHRILRWQSYPQTARFVNAGRPGGTGPSAIGHRPSVIGHRSSAISHQPSVIGHRPSAIGHRPSVIGHRSSVIGHRPSVIGHRPSAIGHRPSVIGHRPSAIGHRPSVIGHRSSAIGHQPSAISHRPSAIGHRPSAIGHRPSAIGHQPSAIGHRPSAIGHRPSRSDTISGFVNEIHLMIARARRSDSNDRSRGVVAPPKRREDGDRIRRNGAESRGSNRTSRFENKAGDPLTLLCGGRLAWVATG
jgi:hypothetical protein